MKAFKTSVCNFFRDSSFLNGEKFSPIRPVDDSIQPLPRAIVDSLQEEGRWDFEVNLDDVDLLLTKLVRDGFEPIIRLIATDTVTELKIEFITTLQHPPPSPLPTNSLEVFRIIVIQHILALSGNKLTFSISSPTMFAVEENRFLAKEFCEFFFQKAEEEYDANNKEKERSYAEIEQEVLTENRRELINLCKKYNSTYEENKWVY